MGASYVAIGDHDLTLDQILHLPIRFAPLASRALADHVAENVAIESVNEPPQPLREAKFWTIEGLSEYNAVMVGLRSFAVLPFGPRLYGFLADLPSRAEMRRLSRAVAEVLGCRRLVFCTNFNADWDWIVVERGERVEDVLAFLTREQRQRLAPWDETWSEAELERYDFNPPFFVDEWES